MATRLPSPEAILLNPLTTPVPDDPDARIAVSAALGRLLGVRASETIPAKEQRG